MPKTEMEMLEDISGKISTQQTEVKAVTEAQKKFEEAQKLADAANAKIADEVKALNEDLAKKGATLEEIKAAVTELKARKGRFSASGNPEEKSAREVLAELFEEKFDEIKTVRKGAGKSFETKVVGTMTASANLTGSVVNSYDLTPKVRGRRKVHMQDLVPTVNSSTGLFSFYRQNNPVGEGSFGFQTTHGAAKAQLDYDLTKVDVTCDYLAGFVRIAKQMLQDLPFLQTFVANELLEDYKRQESMEFFGTLRSTSTGSTTTTATVFAERLIDWTATLMDNDYDPSAIVTSASKWAELLKTKPNDYGVPGGITIAPDGTVMFAGMPVYVANSLYLGGGNKTIIGDWSKAAIVQVEGLKTEFFEQDSDNVQKNLITVRTERRVGFALFRPDAFIAA